MVWQQVAVQDRYSYKPGVDLQHKTGTITDTVQQSKQQPKNKKIAYGIVAKTQQLYTIYCLEFRLEPSS
ncbi:hypothetical protein ACFX2H_013095 [Malus domestica]